MQEVLYLEDNLSKRHTTRFFLIRKNPDNMKVFDFWKAAVNKMIKLYFQKNH